MRGKRLFDNNQGTRQLDNRIRHPRLKENFEKKKIIGKKIKESGDSNSSSNFNGMKNKLNTLNLGGSKRGKRTKIDDEKKEFCESTSTSQGSLLQRFPKVR